MSDPTDLSAVEALLRERDALRGWLERLDRSDASVPEAVRARVRHDYQSRLDGLLERLRQHSDVVATRLLEDQAEQTRLHNQARDVREALAEAELRHAVGEYDAARFESERAFFTSELERHETALDVVSQRIAELEDVHFAVVREPTPSASATQGPVEFHADPEGFLIEDAVVEEVTIAEVTIEDLAPADPVSAATDDLLSIFDHAESDPPSTSGETEASQRRHRVGPPEDRTHGFGPLSFTPKGGVSGSAGPARPAVPSIAPPIGMPGLDQSPRFVRPAPERGSELVELPPERGERFRVIPDPEPVIPEAAAGEAPEANARTLRCGECGAMNRPLEWYCEKCGAELSAV